MIHVMSEVNPAIYWHCRLCFYCTNSLAESIALPNDGLSIDFKNLWMWCLKRNIPPCNSVTREPVPCRAESFCLVCLRASDDGKYIVGLVESPVLSHSSSPLASPGLRLRPDRLLP